MSRFKVEHHLNLLGSITCESNLLSPCRPTGTSPTDTPGRMQRKTAESTAPTSVVSSLLPSRSSSTVCLTGDFDLFSHNLSKEKEGDNQDKWHKLNPTLLGKKY